ncbi:dihydrofolate reductase family protein [Mucilaginibacter jinjuensis]|uniref:Dihydrofolate reductase family protein n=1 Tax=Mucilaginibacter jinjuensis TaxID=1176721 RepID=A0ABY7T789_9SPHI|nr:dihydrofolate reductase family protein [Mucilaginibacter jinjuensis]WCT12129.1 dihydrofolate reductase family protein [Mucilaginibacter jinjuensis]
MRKVILNLAVSLDGFIEGPNGEYDWCLMDQDYGLTEFWDSIDTLFVGRKSYELLTNTGEISHFSSAKMYVFSDTLAEVQHDNVEIISGANLVEDVNAIKNQEGKSIWFFGGASLLSSFMANGLVDEFLLSIHPILLGGGKALFQSITERTDLQLVETIPYSSGLVQLRYQLLPKFDLNNIAGADY